MIQENVQIRLAAKNANVPLWAVARELGISEPTITRWLRVPLSNSQEEKILAVIDKLSKEVNNGKYKERFDRPRACGTLANIAADSLPAGEPG